MSQTGQQEDKVLQLSSEVQDESCQCHSFTEQERLAIIPNPTVNLYKVSERLKLFSTKYKRLNCFCVDYNLALAC